MMTAPHSEKELIQEAKAGDAAAWELIMRTHQERVFRLAYLHLRDPAEAEDIAQEAFIRAHKNLARFDETRPFNPWVMRIATNLAHNRRRAAGRYLSALKRWAIEKAVNEPPAHSRDEKIEAEALWHAVSTLSQKDQSVIYLRYFLNLSVSETAQTLGVAEGTVKSRLNRALKKLQGVIMKDFPELGPNDD